MKKYNYIVSVVMLLLSGYIFYESGGYTIGSSAQKNPAVWPCILAGALALLSVALIIETALKKEPGEEKKTIDWKSPGMIHVYIMLGIVVGFVVLMKIVGMLLALLIMIPAIEYLMGCRSKVMLIALPVGMVAFVYLFFVVAMKLTLPAPRVILPLGSQLLDVPQLHRVHILGRGGDVGGDPTEQVLQARIRFTERSFRVLGGGQRGGVV